MVIQDKKKLDKLRTQQLLDAEKTYVTSNVSSGQKESSTATFSSKSSSKKVEENVSSSVVHKKSHSGGKGHFSHVTSSSSGSHELADSTINIFQDSKNIDNNIIIKDGHQTVSKSSEKIIDGQSSGKISEKSSISKSEVISGKNVQDALKSNAKSVIEHVTFTPSTANGTKIENSVQKSSSSSHMAGEMASQMIKESVSSISSSEITSSSQKAQSSSSEVMQMSSSTSQKAQSSASESMQISTSASQTAQSSSSEMLAMSSSHKAQSSSSKSMQVTSSSDTSHQMSSFSQNSKNISNEMSNNEIMQMTSNSSEKARSSNESSNEMIQMSSSHKSHQSSSEMVEMSSSSTQKSHQSAMTAKQMAMNEMLMGTASNVSENNVAKSTSTSQTRKTSGQSKIELLGDTFHVTQGDIIESLNQDNKLSDSKTVLMDSNRMIIDSVSLENFKHDDQRSHQLMRNESAQTVNSVTSNTDSIGNTIQSHNLVTEVMDNSNLSSLVDYQATTKSYQSSSHKESMEESSKSKKRVTDFYEQREAKGSILKKKVFDEKVKRLNLIDEKVVQNDEIITELEDDVTNVTKTSYITKIFNPKLNKWELVDQKSFMEKDVSIPEEIVKELEVDRPDLANVTTTVQVTKANHFYFYFIVVNVSGRNANLIINMYDLCLR